MLKNSTVLIACLFLVSCGGQLSSHRKYGKMNVSELVTEKGQPLREEAIPIKDGKVLHYEHEEKFQVKGDIVTNSFRNPSIEESSLLYWKNAFKECDTEEKVLKPKGDSPAELELKCKSKGQSVLYTDGSPFISRVLEYAPE